MEPSNMKTLLDLVEEAYHKHHPDLPYKSVRSFLHNDKESATFIRMVLQDEEFCMPDENSSQYRFAQNRARHSAITYLIGLVFQDFLGLSFSIANHFYILGSTKNSFPRLWMLTALYHDWGYYSERLGNAGIVYREEVQHYLLTDSYLDNRLHSLNGFRKKHEEAFAYEYEEIEAYDAWARRYHARNQADEKKKKTENSELVDHGILGGVFVFDNLVRRALRLKRRSFDDELFLAKISCLTISQHNIFKSPDAKRDVEYGDTLKKIHSTSDFVINQSTPLLLLLCLVDTFECVKRLSKGQNESKYLESVTVLSNIWASVSYDEIVLDFEELSKRVDEKKDKDLQDAYKRYRDTLRGIHTWTTFALLENGKVSRIILNPELLVVATN